jgi:pimeloyl-ACP methyl ester carboxylesterase
MSRRRAAAALLLLTTTLALDSGAAAQESAPTLSALDAWRRAELERAGFARRALDGAADRLVYFERGSGTPLVFLHGVGDHAGTWQAVAPAFADRYRVVLPDLPGHGESAPAEGALPMATVVAGAERLLVEIATEHPAIVVGNSMGAWLATLLAHRHPERVERLVLTSGGAVPGDPGAPSLMPQTREQAAYLMSFLRDPQAPELTGAMLDELVERSASGPLARMMGDLPGLVGHMLVGRLGEVHSPVDLLWGASDRLMTLGYAERMAAQLPAARVTVLERCGHVPQVECPERYGEALASMLAAAAPQPNRSAEPAR